MKPRAEEPKLYLPSALKLEQTEIRHESQRRDA
jgi:hypothetical protein